MSADRSTVDALAAFLTNVIQTVDRLDVLLLLHGAPSRSWTASAVARELQLSNDAANRELEALCARGLLSVAIGANLSYTFAPIDGTQATLVRSLAELHGDRPTEVAALLQPSTRPRGV